MLTFSSSLLSQTHFTFLHYIDAVEAPLLELVPQILHNLYMMMKNIMMCFCQVSLGKECLIV